MFYPNLSIFENLITWLYKPYLNITKPFHPNNTSPSRVICATTAFSFDPISLNFNENMQENFFFKNVMLINRTFFC